MSRLRRSNDKILYDMLDKDDGIYYPIDYEEQEELITKFQLHNSVKNDKILKLLSIIYLLFCGGFFLMISNPKLNHIPEISNNKRIILLSIQSICCSLISLRYELINYRFTLRGFQFRLNNSNLSYLNIILLVLLSWIIFEKIDSNFWRSLFHLPHLLLLVSFCIKHWIASINEDLETLKGLKYKFKNV